MTLIWPTCQVYAWYTEEVTGALKTACHKRLKQLKYVKDFRLGEFGEGGTGVTIVTFK